MYQERPDAEILDNIRDYFAVIYQFLMISLNVAFIMF